MVDDGLKQGTQMGPLQNKAQFEKVKGFLEDAKRNGKIVAGGEVLGRKGYFIQPTIVRDISDDARLVTEEQFGPVVPVLRYSDVDDAIARANDSDYGLGGTVWAKDLDRAFQVAARIETGTVWINSFLDVSPDISFGGAKQSGIGARIGSGRARSVHPGQDHHDGEVVLGIGRRAKVYPARPDCKVDLAQRGCLRREQP